MTNPLSQVLSALDATPVLMDIGASGQPPPIWQGLAPHSVYVGFDADSREIHEGKVAGFRRSVIINEAVTHEPGASDLVFYLTRSPYCSTTLAPNPPATAPWIERDYFDVLSTARVRATTIDCVLKRLNLAGIDWLKLDTQGIDLRLINSVSPDVFTKILAIDTEPGLIEIYQAEDMFVDVHRDLTKKGFWLSDVHIGGFLRMRRTTLDETARANEGVDERFVRDSVRTSPAYIEARYLRTLDWLADAALSEREYALLWVFALTDSQLGFALDIGSEFQRRFGANEAWRTLNGATLRAMKSAHRRRALAAAVAPGIKRVQSMVRRLVG